MSMRRVSSRPRLVSDADRASQIASIDLEENHDSSDPKDSYFLMEHDDDVYPSNDYGASGMNHVGGKHCGDYALKSAPAVITGDDEEKITSSAAAAHSDTKMSLSTSSDDNFSDYASCCLYDEDINDNKTKDTASAPLANLEMSFKKTSLSSNEDEGGMEAAAAAYTDRQLSINTTSSSVKRKRLSQQHYLTPNSSYAELHQHSWYPSPTISPLTPVAFGNDTIQAYSRKQPHYNMYTNTPTIQHFKSSSTQHHTLTTLPEETLTLISTHLTHTDIRSLGSTCHVIRNALMSSACAIENLWMEALRMRFPAVFCHNNSTMHSSHVNFVDEFMLPMAAGGLVGVDISNNRNTVNLPLLTGLLPPCYPQKVDLTWTKDLLIERGGHTLRLVPGLFRWFDMTIPAAATVVGGAMMEEGDVISVIQFTGRVGNGDRSVQSDKPFPPNCRIVVGSSRLKRLSTWMRNHTPLRSRDNKRRSGGRGHSLVRDLSPPPPLHRQFSTTTSCPTTRSPLFRFISSLSHHCDCVSSSNGSSSLDDNEDDVGFSLHPNVSSHDDDNDIGVNDYGMMIRRNGNGLLEQCKQKLGYTKSIEDNLRPFVIPTVVSSSGEGVSVDLTPRLVAYFEVTIIDQEGEASRDNETVLPYQPPQRAALNPNDLRRRGHQPRLRRRSIPGHRFLLDPAFFPILDAQERLEGQGAAAPNIDNFDQPPPHFRNEPDNNGNDNNARQRQQRHDCVAIGLSTRSFNCRSRMPGWDQHSFGYHGDDGGLFHGHGDMLRRYGPRFGPGDTVGCGLEYATRKIFFTKNGVFLGWAFEKIDKEMVDRGLYPTVGVDTECPIHVNFGQVPFKFDWKRLC